MKHLLPWLSQVAALAVVFGLVAALSDWPPYNQIPAQAAVIKLSFSHSFDRSTQCRRRTAEELAALPPNMRNPMLCPRLRLPIYVELDIDGATVLSQSLPPSGLAKDGPSRIYRRFVVPTGRHDISVRLRDTARTDGFDYVRDDRVVLKPSQSFVIDFQLERGGFVFR